MSGERKTGRLRALLAGWALVGALGVVAWRAAEPWERAGRVSALPGRGADERAEAAVSATGHAYEQRELILPDRSEESFHWIAQTQQMLARGEWRVRQVDYDNAPAGREVWTASPYRWWLGLLAACDHLASRRPLGRSVEFMALLANPLLGVMVLLGGSVGAARCLGGRAAVVWAVGWAATFPLAAEFCVGVPSARALAIVTVVVSLLALVVGMSRLGREDGSEAAARRWFIASGVVGGGGLWVSIPTMAPILVGMVAGALFAAMIARRDARHASCLPPWRAWALGGAATVLLAYLIEYFPEHLGTWRLDLIHPLHGLAWLGVGEGLSRGVARIQRSDVAWRARDWLGLALAVLAVGAVPVVMSTTGQAGLWARDLGWMRLTPLAESAAATSCGAWIRRDGFDGTVAATLLPLVGGSAVAAVVLLGRRDPSKRASLALVLGPAGVAAGFAGWQLSWWSVLDGVLLVVVVTAASSREAATTPRPQRWRWAGWLMAGACLIPGMIELRPPSADTGPPVLSSGEAPLLIERDLAHWLARHARYERPVVYAPPETSAALAFYGSLRVIGTYGPDNEAALAATLRIAGAASVQEARLLLQGREVRYLVLPSWDGFFEDYARLYEANNGARWNEFFLTGLREGRVPPWLRLLPYETPEIGGLGRETALVFEVVDEQGPAVAAGRLAETLLAIGEQRRAAELAATLRAFPGDVGALAAEAQLAFAVGDAAGLERSVEGLLRRLRSGADPYLPWDRRVSVAIVLARAKQFELARVQVKRCVAEFDEERANALSAGSLYNLLGLARSFGFEFPNTAAREWSLQLLPAELRARVQ